MINDHSKKGWLDWDPKMVADDKGSSPISHRGTENTEILKSKNEWCARMNGSFKSFMGRPIVEENKLAYFLAPRALPISLDAVAS